MKKMKTGISVLFSFIICLVFFGQAGLSQCTNPLLIDAGANATRCPAGPGIQLGGTPTAQAGTAPYTYSWSPSAGLDCANCPNPVATNGVTTTYTLTVSDAGNVCQAQDQVTVTVSPVPVPGFNFSPANACANIPVQFTNTSTGSGLTYAWTFGDPASGTANTSTAINPTHFFTATGAGTQSFSVTLTVTNSSGCQASVTQSVTVKQTPPLALDDPFMGFKNCDGTSFGLTVLESSGSSGITNYQIQWGDGSPNFNAATFPGTVNHTYNTQDIFDLLYIATGTNGCIDTLHQIVTNITNPAIGAANPGGTNGCGPFEICFPLTNFSSNHPSTTYRVDFGDGSPVLNLPHPPPAVLCHTYNQSSCGFPGNSFTFRMKAINLCDSSEATISPIRIYKPPTPDFTPNPNPACTGSPVTMLNSTQTGYNTNCASSTVYLWDFGDGTPTLTTATATSPSHVYAAPGTYTVTLTTTNVPCGSSFVSKTVCVENPPVPNFTISQNTGCVPFNSQVTNTSTTLNTCNVTRVWSVLFNGSSCSPTSGTWSFAGGTNAGSVSPLFQFSTPGSYTIRLTLTNACGSFIFDRSVTAQGLPQVTVNALSSICAGQSVAPSANINSCYEPADSYQWTLTGGSPSSSSAMSPGSVTYATGGSFNLTLQATNQCGSASAGTSLTVNPLPPGLSPTVNSPICAGGTAQFTAATVSNASYTWSGPNSFSSSLQNPQITSVTAANAGTYSVYATINGCQGPTQTVNLVINPLPTVNAGADFAICQNAPAVTLTATPSGGTWSGTGVTAAGLFTPSSAGTFNLTYTYTNGCAGSDAVVITVNPLPTANAGADISLCNQPVATTLTGSPAGGTWSGTGITNPSGQFTPFATGSFPVVYTVTNFNGCAGRDTMIVNVINPTSSNAGADQTICADAANIQLTGTPAGGTWTGTAITSAGLFDPTTAGTFPMVYTFGTGSCLTRDTMRFVVNPLPTVNAGADFSVCQNGAASNHTGTPAGGTWTGTGITSGGVFTPATAGAGTHTLTYTYTHPSTGCINSDNLVATVFAQPTVAAGADLFLCNQPIPVTLSGTPTGGTWTGSGITNPAGEFTPSSIGIFPIVYTFTSANGCISRDTLIINVGNPSNASAGPDSTVCIDAANVQLTGTPTGGNWTGTGITSAGLFDPTTAGNFALVYNVGTGTCVSRDTMHLIVNPLPVVNAGTDFAICLNAPSINLTATPANGTWTGTGVSAAGNFNPATSGVGTVSLTYTYTSPVTHCTNSDIIVITVNPLPTPNAGPDLGLCNQPIAQTLTGTPAGGTWSGTGITNPSGEFTPFITGSFPVVYAVTSNLGCTNRDTTIITVSNPANANAGADSTVCIDAANVQLTATPAGGTWSGTGITSSGLFDPTAAGTFTMTYTFGSGTCLTTDQMNVIVNPLPVVDAGANFNSCIDAPNATLTGSPAGGTWTGTGVTNPSGTFNPATAGAGTFTLTYTYTHPTTHCQNSDVLSVTVNPLPILNAGNDTTLCNQPIGVTLTGTPSGGVWSGNNVTAGGIFTPSATGNTILTYTVTAATGCDAADNVQIQVVNAQQADAGPDQEICIFSSNVQLNGLPAGGTWSGTGITSAGVFTPNTAGNFNLVYTYGGGNCLTRDTMIYTVHALPLVNAGANQDFCLTDDAVDFAGNPTSGTWSGTGITNSANGTFNPGTAAVGSFNIVYTYTNPVTTCVNRDTLVAIVHPLPVPNFTYNAIVCANNAEVFTNTTSLGSTYAWDFGDGGAAATANPSHTFTAVGFFDVQLIATSAFGCVDSITKTIEVREPPVADFTLSPDSSCAPVIVNFTNNSTGISVTYSWNFGNGTTSTLEDPASGTYFEGVLADTTYFITLNVTNFCGTATHTESVIAMPKPKSIFGTNFDTGCSPFTVDIANNSLGLPDTYFWDFGDGTTSTNPNALLSHTFTTGTSDTVYTIMLVVTNECGADTSYHNITVLPNQVNAFFNTNVTSGCVPLTVNFTQFSTGANTYNWEFGDGNTSNGFSPTHTFTTAGTFTVSLMINDGCSYDTAKVDITVFPSPTVAFSSAPDSTCINEPFTFTNTSTGLTSTAWDFGDGQSSTLNSPTHAYTASGTYQVTLTGTSSTNSCTASVTHPVVVSINPVAAFTPIPVSGCVPLQVSFGNTSTNTAFQTWTFGDGNFSSQVNPVHVFQNAGTYTVKLLVENANGCLDSVSHIITVYPVPVANFTVSTSNACYSPVSVSTTNTSTGAINYAWTFGNGNNSALTNPVATYNTPGTYTIQLTAANAYGCSSVHTETVTVYPTPSAAFTVSEDTICVGETVTLSSQSTFADSIVWLMGDGNQLTGNSITYQYGTAGTYNITVIAYGAGGCGDTLTLTSSIVVHPTPIAGFDYVNVQNPDPLSGTVEFTNTSIGGTYYTWDFGNGVTSHDLNPIERYNAYGDFGASLIAYNQFGCSDTIEQLVVVDFFNGLFVPNAIYPGHPDFGVANFLPKGVGLATYEILIYDDWGNLIWESTALDADGRPIGFWDGKFNGEPVQQDAYVWKVSATFLDTKVWRGKEYPGGKFKKSGTVTVIR